MQDKIPEVIECMEKVLPYIRRICSEDSAITFVDRERILAYIPSGKINMQANIGDQIEPHWAVTRAMTENRRVKYKAE